MTCQNLIDAHYLQTNRAKDLIKAEIKTFFDANKDKERLLYLINNEFYEKTNKFNYDYNVTIPSQLVGTNFETDALLNSLNAYLDLMQYPSQLVGILAKNNEHNLSNLDELL